jgi:hypothetical protein
MVHVQLIGLLSAELALALVYYAGAVAGRACAFIAASAVHRSLSCMTWPPQCVYATAVSRAARLCVCCAVNALGPDQLRAVWCTTWSVMSKSLRVSFPLAAAVWVWLMLRSGRLLRSRSWQAFRIANLIYRLEVCAASCEAASQGLTDES